MTSATEEWSFLDDAWRYALVLTGREETALELVESSLEKLARRTDAADPSRAKKILFSTLYRSHRTIAAPPAPTTPAETAANRFRGLPEPGRSAWILLSLGLFAGEDLAGLLGETTSDLAAYLTDVRRAFPREDAA